MTVESENVLFRAAIHTQITAVLTFIISGY